MHFTTSPQQKSFVAAVAVVACLTLGAPAARANLVLNGGFETGDFTDWTVSGNVFDAQVPIYSSIGSTAANGAYAPVFNSGDRAPNATLSQTFATVAGTRYIEAFDYGSGTNGGFQSITASVTDGSTVLASIDQVGTVANIFVTTTFTFVADSNSTTIKFVDDSGNFTFSNDGFLDNVSINAVPEPASVALLAVGLAGLVVLKRSRAS